MGSFVEYVDFDPFSTDRLVSIGLVYWPALVTLFAVAIAAWRRARFQRSRPPHRLARPSNLWSLPLLVWAFQTSLATMLRQEHLTTLDALGLRNPWFFWISLYEAILALCILTVLQLLAVSILDRGFVGIGPRGPSRVAMIYAIATVVLDGFFLLCIQLGRWPEGAG